MNRFPVAALSLLLLASGCKQVDPEPEIGPAPGVQIAEVAIYQAVKHSLMIDGEQVDSDVPLVAGRDALVRVFVTSDDSYDEGEIVGRLTLGDEVIEARADRVWDESREDRMDTTVNFEVPGDSIGSSLEWRVELLQEGAPADGNAEAAWPSSGTVTTEVEGRANTLRLIVAPFSYEFDGSGRLPDLSDERMEELRARFLSLYPVSDVEVELRDPEPWTGELGPNGSGWQGVGWRVYQMRQQDGESDDVYYYGMFNPAASLGQYCSGGCLLGVTLLNDSPPDTGSVELRLALGVGFDETVLDTAAHEIGHAHGRQHAPCGPPGNLPDGIDPQFPHGDGGIGVPGWDLSTGELRDPDDFTDIMGYCDDQFVSDFTYAALFRRGQNVNLADSSLQPIPMDVLAWDGEQASWALRGEQSRLAGRALPATARRGGESSEVDATYLGWDHLPGGLIFLPHEDGVQEVTFTLDGQTHRVPIPE